MTKKNNLKIPSSKKFRNRINFVASTNYNVHIIFFIFFHLSTLYNKVDNIILCIICEQKISSLHFYVEKL